MTTDELMALADEYTKACVRLACDSTKAQDFVDATNALRAALEAQAAEIDALKADIARYACFTMQAVASLGFQPVRGKDIALMVSLLKAGGLPQDDIDKACRELRAAIDQARKATNANT